MPTSAGLYDTSTLTYDTATSSYDGYPSPLANMPALGVYIGWVDGPYVAEPAWTDVSYLARQITVRRGRQDDLQQFPSGQCSITFDNTQRLFDPFNTSGTWYAYLKPRRQIKVVAIWNGVSYPIFRGFVAGWPVEYTDGGLDSTVTVDCFDLIGLVGASTFDPDRYQTAIKALSPVNYWPMNELAQSQSSNPTLADYGSRNTFSLKTDLSIQSIGSQNVRGLTSPMFNPDGYVDGSGGVLTVGSSETTDWSMSFWGKTYEGRKDYTSTLVIYTNVPSFTLYFTTVYSPAQSTQFGLTMVCTGPVRSESSKVFTDDQPHHVVINYQRSVGELRIWVDGVDVTVVKSSLTNVSAPFPVQSFSWRDQLVYPGGTGKSPDYGKVGITQLAMFDRTLTSAEITALYQAGFGFKNETSAARITAYMNEQTIPAGLRNITSTPVANVGDYVTNGRTFLDAVKQIVDTEGGEFYVNASGVMQFTDRNAYFTGRSATSQATFTDTGTGINYDANGIRLAFDADRVRNSVAISTPDGFNATSFSAASIADNGEAGETYNTAFVSNADAQTYADTFISLYKNPKLQVEPFMAKGQANPSYNWPRLLALELLDRITFKRTPSVGSAIQKDLLVQSIEHRITPGTWETVVNGSTRYTGWFIIGTSLIGSTEDVLL